MAVPKVMAWEYVKKDEILGEEAWSVLLAVADMVAGSGGPPELDELEVVERISIDDIENHARDIWTWRREPEIRKVYIAQAVGPGKFRFKRKWLTNEKNRGS